MTLALSWLMSGRRSLRSARCVRGSVGGRWPAVARSKPPGRPSPRPLFATSDPAVL